MVSKIDTNLEFFLLGFRCLFPRERWWELDFSFWNSQTIRSQIPLINNNDISLFTHLDLRVLTVDSIMNLFWFSLIIRNSYNWTFNNDDIFGVENMAHIEQNSMVKLAVFFFHNFILQFVSTSPKP